MYASHIYVSESRIEGQRYMHVSGSCINARIMHHIYVHHGHVYQDQEYMHQTYIHHWMIKERVYMYHGYMHHVYIHQGQSLSILLLESPCQLVRPEQNFSRIIHTCSIVKYQGSWMYASYINASFTYA